jgi:hypothetical protein
MNQKGREKKKIAAYLKHYASNHLLAFGPSRYTSIRIAEYQFGTDMCKLPEVSQTANRCKCSPHPTTTPIHAHAHTHTHQSKPSQVTAL